jgi:PAS domain S-box-containing protein
LEQGTALRESEQRFRLLVEAVQDYAIFLLDPEGYVTSWNIGAERIKGYKGFEIIGQHFSRFYPEEDVRAGKPARELEIARREGRVEDEGWRLRKDGSKFWALVVITALRDPSGQAIGFAKVTRDFTERRKAQQQLEASQRRLQQSEESLRRLSMRLLRTQDEERRRIARDLHDSLGQILSVLKMKLDSLSTAVVGDSEDGKQLALAAHLTEEAVKEVRTISYLLYPPMLEELGLKSAIAWFLDGFAQRSGIKTSLTATSGFPRLAGDVELTLFRVLQESLTNVHRHSGSASADVELSVKDESALLLIRDYGKGMRNGGEVEQSFQDWTGAFGVGLRGMSERLRQVGGNLELRSTPRGTTVRATVPAGEGDRRQISP